MTSMNGPSQLPAILVTEGRSEGERSEAERSADAAKIAARAKANRHQPNPEVVAKAKRRRFKGDYKLRICKQPTRQPNLEPSEPFSGVKDCILRSSPPGVRNARPAYRKPSARTNADPSPRPIRWLPRIRS